MTGDCAPNVIGPATASCTMTSTGRRNPLSIPSPREIAGRGPRKSGAAQWRRRPSPMDNLERNKRAPHAQKARTIASPVTRGCCVKRIRQVEPGTPGATTDRTRATGRAATTPPPPERAPSARGVSRQPAGVAGLRRTSMPGQCAAPCARTPEQARQQEVPAASMADALTMSVSSPNSLMSTRA